MEVGASARSAYLLSENVTAAIPDIKKPRGRPKVGSELIGVRVPPELLAKLDAWIDSQDPKPSRPEAIRAMVEVALKAGEPD